MRRWTMLGAVAMATGGGCQILAGLRGEDVLLQIDGGSTSSTVQVDGGGAEPSCSDGKKNGDETGEDCGGPCTPCPDGEGCLTGGDCESNSCGPAAICVAPACSDQVKNQDETDVDCGGKSCSSCGFGGACVTGEDCVTGFCDAKKCDARTVVQGLTNPNSLGVDKTNVYWADGDSGTVTMANIATGVRADIATGQSMPQGLVIVPGMPTDLDPSSLAWVEPSVDGGAGRVDRASVGSKPGAVSSIDGGNPLHVVPGGQYWTNVGFFGSSNSIMRSNGGSPEVLIPLDFPPGRIAREAGNPASLAFCLIKAGAWAPTDLCVVPATPNATPTVLATYTINAQCSAITADQSFVYWADDSMGTVAKVAVTGGTPVVIASGQDKPTDVAVDTLFVYWVTEGVTPGSGNVMKAPIAGGSPTVLAPGQHTPRAIFVSGNDVYWISGAHGQGAVKSVRK